MNIFYDIIEDKTVCFTGHRHINYQKTNCLENEIRKAVLLGYDTFLSGGAIGFDQLAARFVLNLKEEYPFIRLIFVLPCDKYSMSSKWNAIQKKEFYNLCNNADGIICLSNYYYDGCMKKRNEKLVELSSYCIAYMTRERSGTGQTVRMMRKKGCNIVIL